MSLYLCRAKWLENTYDREGFMNDEPKEHDEIRIVEADGEDVAAQKLSAKLRIKVWYGGESYGEKHWVYVEPEINEVIK
jgi:hypothetical protein